MLKKIKSPYLWCFTIYFAEGFPYSVIRMLSSLFLRTMNVSLPVIGFTSFFSLPWIFKFFWAPLLDKYSTKKNWLIFMQMVIGFIFFLIAISSLSPLNIKIIFLLFFTGAIFAATNDIAIDGYYIDVLDKKEQSKFVGYRVMAYRIAMIFGTGVIATVGTKFSWFNAFVLSSLLMILIAVFHLFCIPLGRRGLALTDFIKKRWMIFTSLIILSFVTVIILLLLKKRSSFDASFFSFFTSSIFVGGVGFFLLAALFVAYLLRNKIMSYCKDRFYLNAFVTFIDQENIFLIIGFIVFLRAGEFFLASMLSPFIVDLGLKNHYGWMQSFIGLPASILGAIAGGYLISRYSLKKVFMPILLAQNGTNLLYMIIAFFLSNFISLNTGNSSPLYVGFFNHFFVLLVLAFDQFAGGLGTSLLIYILMKICKEEYRASHYAIGSGLMNITSLITGMLSGFVAREVGYSLFFGISFLCSLPGMIFALLIVNKLLSSE